MSAKWLGLCLAVFLIIDSINAHGSYQVPPSGAPRQETYNSVPIRQQEQTYGTPPPKTYSSPPPQPIQEPPRTYDTQPPAYEAPKTYTTPQPIQEQPKVYETPPPPCPNGGKRHPSTGDCLVNECETGQHDCHRNAKCIDTFESYTCACTSGYIDESEADRPGRVCSLPQTNNCASGKHKCSPDAVCTDSYNGPVCRCNGGYVDLSPDTRSNPGQQCKKIVHYCSKPELNSCSKNATCYETYESYKCVCNEGFKDVDPSNPGRECELIKVSPCSDSSKNDCHKDADCMDDAKNSEGYTCHCHNGFADRSSDPLRPGRVCEKFIETPISIVIVKDGENPTPISSKYTSVTNKPAVEIIDKFTKDLGTTVLDTRYGPAYINTTVVKISSPKSVNPQVDDGIILNSTVLTAASAGPVNACALFDAVVEKIQANGGFVGGGQLKIGDDVQKLNPCPQNLCGGKICNAALGETCINGQCQINFCVDGFCPVNSTCVNLEDHGHCECKPGFVDIRNVSESIRLQVGYKQDQYCLRGVDVNYCALGLHDCHEAAICIPLIGNYTCKCNNGTVDQNPERPGRVCDPIAAPIVLPAPSTLPWWLMLLLALLFLLLTLCCCLWALSRLRWFKRRGIMDQTGSSYSDLVIPRPKVRSLDAESMGSGSSEFTIREEIERRVVTDVTRTELHMQENEEEVNEHETYTHTTKVDNDHFVR